MADFSDPFSSSEEFDSCLDESLSSFDIDDDSSDPEDSTTSPPLRDPAAGQINPRAYQLEMLAESLKQNIIVAVQHFHSLGLATGLI